MFIRVLTFSYLHSVLDITNIMCEEDLCTDSDVDVDR